MLGVYLTKKRWISLRVHDECMIKKHSNYARWPRKMITYACDHRMSSNPSLAAKTDHIASAGRTTGCPEVSGRLEEQIPLFSLGCSAADKNTTVDTQMRKNHMYTASTGQQRILTWVFHNLVIRILI